MGTLESFNPATGQLVGTVGTIEPADVNGHTSEGAATPIPDDSRASAAGAGPSTHGARPHASPHFRTVSPSILVLAILGAVLGAAADRLSAR